MEPLIKQVQEISFVTVAVVNLEFKGAVLPVEVKTIQWTGKHFKPLALFILDLVYVILPPI